MQVIYIDILFLVNFIMDIFIFTTASLLLAKKIIIKRILIASLIASSLYCMLIIIPSLQTLPFNLYYLTLPCIPIFYLFKPTTIKIFCKVYFISLLSASIIGGFTFNIYYHISYLYGSKSSIIIPFVCGGGVTLLVYGCITIIRKKILLLHCEARVSFIVDKNKITLDGIVDTGNTLYTVFSKQPVTIVSIDKIDKFLSNETKDFIMLLDQIDDMSEILSQANSIHQIIPFESVGCKNGIIAGIKVDELIINRGDYFYKHRDGIIGICKDRIFKNENYSVLIHPDLIN